VLRHSGVVLWELLRVEFPYADDDYDDGVPHTHTQTHLLTALGATIIAAQTNRESL